MIVRNGDTALIVGEGVLRAMYYVKARIRGHGQIIVDVTSRAKGVT